MSAHSRFSSLFPEFGPLVRRVEFRRFPPGEFLCREEEPLTRLYLVLSGEAKVFRDLGNGRTHLFQIYRAGEIVGDIEYFLQIPASCTVRVAKPLEAALIRMNEIESAGPTGPSICMLLGRELAKKLHRESRLSSRNVAYPLRVRLAELILDGGLANYGRGGIQESADRLGTSARHLRRTLKELETAGLILRGRESVEVLDQNAMLRLAEEIYSP